MGMLFAIIHLTYLSWLMIVIILSCYEFSSVSVGSVGFSQMICMMVKSSLLFKLELCSPTVLTSDLSLGETASEVLG